MDSEIKSLIKVWSIAIAATYYCYSLASRIPKGIPRLLALSPVFIIFFILPLNLSTFHFCGPTAFFLAWLANFKLLLFAFDQLPLSNFLNFFSILCLPIKITKNPSPQNPKKHSLNLLFGFKVLLLTLLYDLQWRNSNFIFILYTIHLYLGLEIVLSLSSLPAKAIFGAPLDPQFNEPYFSTSLQDFWGRRWNLMVPNILRPTVYDPTRHVASRVFGPKWARILAVIAAFSVSGLMHEVMYYYLTRASPTWEVTWFFVLHGVCMAAEVAAKAALAGRVRVHVAVSGPLTLGFLMVTANWLMFPQLLRNGVVEKAIGEYGVLVDFVKAKMGLLFSMF